MLPHTPYSPDVAPSDFPLFGPNDKALQDCRTQGARGCSGSAKLTGWEYTRLVQHTRRPLKEETVFKNNYAFTSAVLKVYVILTCTVNTAITRGSLKRIGYNAVCITRNSAYACWLLHDFSDQCEDTGLDNRQKIYNLTRLLLCDLLQRDVSQESNYRVIAELSV